MADTAGPNAARRDRVSPRILFLIALLVLVLLLHPWVQARGKALAVLAEALGAPFPRPFAPDVERMEILLAGVRGDLYEPRQDAPPILLLPGAAPEGKDDPRAVRLATALARAGRTIFVPAMRLAEKDFDPADIDDIGRSVQALAARSGKKVLVFGISYGGSFGLIAASDRTIAEKIEKVAVFGAYFDLVGLIQAASTGVSTVDGRRIPWDPEPRARDVLWEAALQLAPADQRDALREALEHGIGASELPSDAAAVFRLISNDDPARTFELAGELGRHGRELIETFSPATVAEAIAVPVIAIHSTDDPVTPFGEAIRLEHGIEDVRMVSVSLFQHVDFEGSSRLEAIPDLLRAWRFATWLLGAQA